MKTRVLVAGLAMFGVVLSSCLVWGYDGAADRKTRQALEDTIISFNFQDQPVEQVVEYLSTLGNINVVLDRAKVTPGQMVTLKLSNVKLETAIKLVTNTIGMKYVVRDGVVVISDEEGTRQEPVTRVYDVLDVVAEVPDFEGPNFELGALSNSSNNQGNSTSPWTSTTPGGRTTTTDENQSKSLQERTEALVEMIKTLIEPGTWEAGGY